MADAARIAQQLASGLRGDWSAFARPAQLPPPGVWSIWLMLAGRGFGKTRAGAEWVKSLIEGGASRVALVAATAGDARDIMIEGESGILSVCSGMPNRPVFEPSKRRLTWPNGAIATVFTSEEPSRLRGPQHQFAWLDELASFRHLQETWDMLQFGLRLGKNPRQLITTTPRPLKILRQLVARKGQDVVVTGGSTFDNRDNLAPGFLNTIIHRYEGSRLGRQEINAELLADIEGALWTLDMIEECRVTKADAAPLKRLVVAIDPALGTGENSNATGIIVAGVGTDNHGYVLEDLSGKYSPVEWAQKAIAAYKRHKADRIVAESNQGGQLVEATLRAVDRSAPVKLVHASRGKITRAEPISALYEQHRVHHAGLFAELEDEMTTYEPGSQNSPDRMDALVWALTELMVGYDCPMAFPAVPVGLGRASYTAEHVRDIFADHGTHLPGVVAPAFYGDCSCPPGGWPADHPMAPGASVTSGGFAHLGWSINKRS